MPESSYLLVGRIKVVSKQDSKVGKRILVIGATGFLGEPVAILLKQSSFIVLLLVRDIEKAKEQFGDDFEIVKGDPAEANNILGAPTVKLEDWLQQKRI